MTLDRRVQDLLAHLGDGERFEFMQFLEAIYEARFTGTYIVHNLNGVPQQIDLGPPIKLSICRPESGGLDNSRSPSSG